MSPQASAVAPWAPGLSRERAERWLVPLAAMGAACLFFHRAVLRLRPFMQRDIERVYYPLHAFWAAQVRQGHLPQWYPFDGLGQPFLAIPVAGPFHPANLLYLGAPLELALSLNVLLSYAAALWGTYRLVRAYGVGSPGAALAGAAYAFSGYAVSMSGNLAYLMALATLPWAFLASHRLFGRPGAGRLLLAALGLAGVLLAGDPQAFAVAAVGVVLQGAREARTWGRGAAMGLLVGLFAAGLCGAQVLPTLKAAPEAAAAVNPESVALRWSGQPVRLLELPFGPLFLGGEGQDLVSTAVGAQLDPGQAEWANSMHVGVVVLLLAGVALWAGRRSRGAWWLLGVSTLALVLWLGRHGGLYGWLHRLPLWQAFRYPEKLTPFWALPLAIGAGFGLDALARDALLRRKAPAAAALLAALALSALVGERWLQLYSEGLLGRLWPAVSAATRAELGQRFVLLCAVSAGALAVAAGALRRADAGWARALLVGTVVLHLAWANGGLYWVASPRLLDEPSALLKEIEKDAGAPSLGRFRVAAFVPNPRVEELPPGARLEDWASGDDALSLKSAVPALFSLESADPYLPAANRRVLTPLRPFADSGLFNVRYLVMLPEAARRRAAAGATVAVSQDGRRALVRAPGLLPRAYLAEPVCVADAAAAAALVGSPAFRRGGEAAVECGARPRWRSGPVPGAAPTGPGEGPAPGDGVAGRGGLGGVDEVDEAPDRVEIALHAVRGAMLVLNDAFYPGWSAEVDGQPASILPVNTRVRGVWVDRGGHRVVFSYRTPGLGAGLVVSGLCALLLSLAWGLEKIFFRGADEAALALGARF